MFALLRRSRPQSLSARPRRARLSLEALEERYCLSAPSLTLSAQAIPGHIANLSGALLPNPDGHSGSVAGCSIQFSGAATGSTVTDSQGDFSFSAISPSIGQVTAVGSDQLGNPSNTAQALIWVSPPRLSLSMGYGKQGYITLFGTVSDLDPGNRTIAVSGAVSGSVLTDASGSFSVSLKPSQLGQIQATTSDLWGLNSNTPTVQFSPVTPTITNFMATQSYGNIWTFSGKVVAAEPEGMVVRFDGLPSLKGQTVTVQADGTFVFSLKLNFGETGMATAQTTDWWGQQSNLSGTPVW